MLYSRHVNCFSEQHDLHDQDVIIIVRNTADTAGTARGLTTSQRVTVVASGDPAGQRDLALRDWVTVTDATAVAGLERRVVIAVGMGMRGKMRAVRVLWVLGMLGVVWLLAVLGVLGVQQQETTVEQWVRRALLLLGMGWLVGVAVVLEVVGILWLVGLLGLREALGVLGALGELGVMGVLGELGVQWELEVRGVRGVMTRLGGVLGKLLVLCLSTMVGVPLMEKLGVLAEVAVQAAMEGLGVTGEFRELGGWVLLGGVGLLGLVGFLGRLALMDVVGLLRELGVLKGLWMLGVLGVQGALHTLTRKQPEVIGAAVMARSRCISQLILIDC